MATITLYANKVNQMPKLVQGVKSAINDYKTELLQLQMKAFSIGESVCNLNDVISSIQSSTQTQDEKVVSFDALEQDTEEFIETASSVDRNVADIINQQRAEFYKNYAYLKPECETNTWDKFCEGCKSVGEWCKEHWVAVVTTVVIVIAATVAAVCGVAIAFIAGVAGAIALVMCVADAVCMLVTGGKDIATVLREKGLYTLAEIFQGISFGADLVSIVFPIGAAIKTMAKMGVKTFAKVTIKSAQKAFQEMIEKVFKRGFKNGAKNLGEILFKSVVSDVDDFKTWKADAVKMKSPTKNWIIEGDKLIPSSTVVPGKNNPHGLTMAEIMGQKKFSMFPNEITYKNGYADLSDFSVVDGVPIDMKNMDYGNYTEAVLNNEISNKKFSRILRESNFEQAKMNLPNGITKEGLEKALGYPLTWHEDLNMKKCYLVPTEIHANVGHTGAVGNYKFIFDKIPDISNLLGEKLTQWGIRLPFNISSELVMSQ